MEFSRAIMTITVASYIKATFDLKLKKNELMSGGEKREQGR